MRRALTPARAVSTALAAASLLVVTSCSSSGPSDAEVALRESLNRVVVAANSGDAESLREATDAFVALINRQSGTDLPADEVVRLAAAASRVKVDASQLDQVEVTPTPTTTTPPPTTTSPEPEPTETSESPSPEPTSESPSPEPSVTESPASPASPAASTGAIADPVPSGDPED